MVRFPSLSISFCIAFLLPLICVPLFALFTITWSYLKYYCILIIIANDSVCTRSFFCWIVATFFRFSRTRTNPHILLWFRIVLILLQAAANQLFNSYVLLPLYTRTKKLAFLTCSYCFLINHEVNMSFLFRPILFADCVYAILVLDRLISFVCCFGECQPKHIRMKLALERKLVARITLYHLCLMILI